MKMYVNVCKGSRQGENIEKRTGDVLVIVQVPCVSTHFSLIFWYCRETELCTIKRNSYLCSEIRYFWKTDNRKTESAILIGMECRSFFMAIPGCDDLPSNFRNKE